jgi:hypothetical protein
VTDPDLLEIVRRKSFSQAEWKSGGRKRKWDAGKERSDADDVVMVDVDEGRWVKKARTW